ncbi:MAG: preprotein translocase subunit SecE [Candidatus Jacksonbacteria bacterium RIFOXYC2_FULL_44_29]|nr:MAG: Preprotein translocase, SecE subunit [Parcubacteria group bacterium GW2011_GWC2_44_22]OGY75158.1 MAG: preprotein translocase subunit SecE [Candidatus Jacksonbacteria bacterium RIFOXYA2_FULL_43_12]OGY77145.1 MAG: preprotein translocase subunit SecE [Candidatus Jacksonbacteria bacterium RIFOXYC2_FULL_44_29]OGY77929.1 MAG: preprotein translocase subunit SecE [Candidatus Jacksonbacteria bacterium RIFOXYB2_FULL_44_15]OGY79494.1 MAG: preprotein translocase subunit SecE [Candidatus Jacksonbact
MIGKIIAYFQSARVELKKVTWPNREEIVQKTILVIVISVAIAIYLGLLDYIFTLLLQRLA